MNRHGLWLSLLLGFLAFALDRAHKYLQVELLHWPVNEFRPVMPFFDIGLVFNTGISYGLLGSVPVWAIALLVAVAMIALAVWWARAASRLVRAGLALCIGGALSNALDRAIYGAVADFFWLHWGELSFFVFNLADASISLGVLLLILDFLGIGR
ncbi:MAG: signal peptidase II, partial [Devosia sp.]